MLKSFEDAKKAVLATLGKRQPDNGAEAAWINAQKTAASKMTEDSMKAALGKESGSGFDQEHAVANDIQKEMQKGARRHRRSTRGRKRRARKTRRT
jgi:hypothetical protein